MTKKPPTINDWRARLKVCAPVLLVVIMGISGMARACPMCKDSVAETDAASESRAGAGLNASIYVMLGGLFVAGGLVGNTFYKAAKGK